MWNSDTYAYGDDTDPLYVSVPFYIVLRQGRAHGIFLDNTFRTSFDIGRTDPGLLAFGAVDGALDYYFIDGPTPKTSSSATRSSPAARPCPDVGARLPAIALQLLTRKRACGTWPTPSGSSACPRTSSGSTSTTRRATTRSPGDRERFPDPARHGARPEGPGLPRRPIVDPHPKAQPGWPLYESGLARTRS
jgi:alpha-glucosidase